jgi:hypothetical protein
MLCGISCGIGAFDWDLELTDMMNSETCFGCEKMVEADHRIANHLAMLGSYLRLKGLEITRGNKPMTSCCS